MTARPCGKCGVSVAAGARFCAACGTTVGAAGTSASQQPPAGGRPVLPFAIAGVAVLVFVLVLALRGKPAGAPPQAIQSAPSSGSLPDLSQMSPREAFNRLFTRVMTASEQGDTAQANRFMPMALMAYRNLPEVDIDARYDVALIHLHAGDIAAARALADTIQAERSKHLFGFVLRAAIARFDGKPDAAKAAYRQYLAVADEELRANRPEYDAHRSMLDSFRQTAITGSR